MKQNSGEKVKSPSDTTLYTPALKRAAVENIGSSQNKSRYDSKRRVSSDDDIVERISNFVKSIRMKDRVEAGSSGDVDDTIAAPPGMHSGQPEGFEQARKRTERAILEAEKYQAVIAEPPGEFYVNNSSQSDPMDVATRVVGSGLSDDDFFHLTCHVDGNIIEKIEKGEYVELEKLLPKDRKRRSEENRMERIHSEGSTFLAPVSDRSNKISGFRRWEQAFRVYATIYCGAHPNRAREIWQYVSVISTASSSSLWDNVAEYDITFRHLMAFNPSRSWAVTYNQMWNLCMKDPLPNRGFTGRQSFPTHNNNSYQSNGKQSARKGGTQKRKKPDYCWNFNRGLPCKYGKRCRFIERCSYCDNSSHGINSCPKLDKSEQAAAVAQIGGGGTAPSASSASQNN